MERKGMLSPETWKVIYHVSVGFLTGLGTFLAGAWPVYNALKKKLKEKKDAEPQFVEKKDFESEIKRVRGDMDQLGRIVQSAAIESSNSFVRVNELAGKMENKLDSNEKSIQEFLYAFKTGVDTSLSLAHENCEAQAIKVATFEGRIQGIEKQLERQAS